MPIDEVHAAIAARLGGAGSVSSSEAWTFAAVRAAPGVWLLTLITLLAVLVFGAGAAYVARRASGSTSELTMLLNESASFYARWPEDRLASAPRSETRAEAIRCQRTIALLERRAEGESGHPQYWRGPVDGLRAWLAVLRSALDGPAGTPVTGAYA